MAAVIGWDIGGVNTKAALVADRALQQVVTRPFEVQRAPDRLPSLLVDIAAGLTGDVVAHGVTMTAELSQMFRTKREGVSFVLDAVERAFPGAAIHVYTTDGLFLPVGEARHCPLKVAAANWMATGSMVARHHRNVLVIDIGTTTTDVIPIVDGRVAATGRTDPERLLTGELVYTGAVRTPVEAIVREVPLHGGLARVSAEGFAVVGDAHVWLGALDPAACDAATPDGRPSTREFAGERLARVVCGDREIVDDAAINDIAQAIVHAQLEQIATAIDRVRTRHHAFDTAIVTGAGAFIADRAARRCGLNVISLSTRLGLSGAHSAPAAAVALLLNERIEPLTIIKLGGSVLVDGELWRAALVEIASFAASHRVAIVPGGGPFADRVRWVDAQVGLSDDAAHWMAIAAMDQHAEMIAAIPGFARVLDPSGLDAALLERAVPVIAPLQWLRTADPLPHTWDVTSDSIAAWIAGVLGATRLVLIKPEGATGDDVVDPYFGRALPANLPCSTTTARDLARELKAPAPSPR